jgi:hypothetical protein
MTTGGLGVGDGVGVACARPNAAGGIIARPNAAIAKAILSANVIAPTLAEVGGAGESTTLGASCRHAALLVDKNHQN